MKALSIPSRQHSPSLIMLYLCYFRYDGLRLSSGPTWACPFQGPSSVTALDASAGRIHALGSLSNAMSISGSPFFVPNSFSPAFVLALKDEGASGGGYSFVDGATLGGINAGNYPYTGSSMVLKASPDGRACHVFGTFGPGPLSLDYLQGGTQFGLSAMPRSSAATGLFLATFSYQEASSLSPASITPSSNTSSSSGLTVPSPPPTALGAYP